ncbi:Transcriptional regulator [Streptococcus thermophilus]|nr:Transcriptional regulator [Streptococcus thermophilus]
MGKSQASIGRIENGTTNPTYKTLEEIAAATNTRLVVDFVPIKN